MRRECWRKLKDSCRSCDVASDQQDQGLRAQLVFDRDTASRLGITPATIDQTLYDAYGQRQVSTMFTQLNQYHVVLEVKPEFQKNPLDLRDLFIRTGARPEWRAGLRRTHPRPRHRRHQFLTSAPRQRPPRAPSAGSGIASAGVSQRRPGAAGGLHAPGEEHGADHRQPSGPVPGGDAFVQPGAQRLAGRRGESCEPGQGPSRIASSIQAAFQGTAEAFQASLANEPVLILAALVTVYIVLGVLYESYIHPITILSTLPSAGVGALLALIICRNDFSVIALIGIVLLIGIVKKNAIMMIDFALEAERKKARRRSTPSIRPACCASGPS